MNSAGPAAPPAATRASAPPPPAWTPPAGGAAVAGVAGTERASISMMPAVFEPPRLKLDAVEGWGKSTIGAYSSSKPLFVMCGNETGFRTLVGARLVPNCHSVHATTFLVLLDALAQAADMDFKSIVLDATGGLERLAHEHVCNRDFKGDWGDTGFLSFQKGPKIAVAEILKVLNALDKIRAQTGAVIWLLGHTKIITVKNPLGPDYDQFIGDTSPDTTAVLNKWCDAIFLGKYQTIVDTSGSGRNKGKGKAIGGTQRVMYVDESDAVKAKNRYFMEPNPMLIPDDPKLSAATIWEAVIKHATTAPQL